MKGNNDKLYALEDLFYHIFNSKGDMCNKNWNMRKNFKASHEKGISLDKIKRESIMTIFEINMWSMLIRIEKALKKWSVKVLSVRE